MRIRYAIALAVVCLAGCSSPGTFVSRQVNDSPPRMGKAPVDGTYGLFIAGEEQDLYDVPLKADEPLGFEWAEDGTVRWLFAVAGGSKNRLDVSKTYEWRRMP